MHSDRIEVDTHLVTGAASFIGKLAEAVQSAGIKVRSLVLEPLASGLAVMTPEERERGALLVDIGGGTTDIVGFSKGHVCYTGVIPVGGFQFTNDIVLTFNTTYQAAEDVKLKYASTERQSPSADQEITLPVVGRDIALKLRPSEISQLTRERAQELAQLIRIKLDEDRVDAAVRSRIVLTGGTSNLSGLAELMNRSLSMPVRKGVPEARGAFPAELKDPIYATGVGILLWALDEYVPPKERTNNEPNAGIKAGSTGFMAGLFRQIGRLMPGFFFAPRKGRS
jgi:cell division protein FtsA